MSNIIKRLFRPKDKNAKIKWSLYGRVWREVGLPYWKWLLLGVVCTVIAAGAEGYSVTLVKKVIDEGFISQNMNFLILIGLQIILAFFLKGFFNYVRSLVMSKTGLKTSAALQGRIYKHIIRTDIAGIQEGGIGKFINYFNVQAGAVLNLVTSQVIGIVQNISSLAIMLALMLWFAPQMCLILLFLVPGLMIPLIIITRYRNKKTREYFNIANASSHHINQSLAGLKTIQSFGQEDFEAGRFRAILEKSMVNSYKNTRVGSLRAPLMEFVISIGLGVSLIFAGHFITNGIISTGDFTAFILALSAAYKPAKSATGINEGIQQGLIAAEVLFDFLDSVPAIRDVKSAADLAGGKMKIQYKNVSFAYNATDGDVLSGINLNVGAGKVCAFVGHSGGGKSTMFNLLERFYDPQQGQILINGKDLKKYTLASIRKNIAEVSQDVFLFNETILENIRYGNPNATREQIIDAAKIANAHDFIMELPKQYHTPAGERGSLLSGGQKQRVAIARAVLKDAPILLMDEATSALDTESEKLIQSAMKKLMRGRTTFVIAHRLSTILDADMICVIKDGRIVEQGTDAELVAMGGEYKKLRDIQFKKKEA